MYFDVGVTSKIALRGKKCRKHIACSWKKERDVPCGNTKWTASVGDSLVVSYNVKHILLILTTEPRGLPG